MRRENPWHVRLPDSEHEQWFKNLVDLHELTNHWVRDLRVDRPAHFLTRGLSQDVLDHLWILDTLSGAKLTQFLEETQPEELLLQLEKTIWAVQSWTLNHILKEDVRSSTSPLKNLLEQTSWKAGRLSGENRWSRVKNFGQLDLAAVFFALQDSPLSGYPRSKGTLIRRATAEMVELELRHCPHQLALPEIRDNRDLLCQLHSQWCRGFVYTLNQRVSVEHSIGSPHCSQRWCFG